MRRPKYGFRYFNGHTVRHYLETTGIVRHGDHVVMDGHFERGLFTRAKAAEVFCQDFSADWIVIPGIVFLKDCTFCGTGTMAQVVSAKSNKEVFICRQCGYSINKPNEPTIPIS